MESGANLFPDREALGELLERLYDRYDSPDFIGDDPICIPHRFTRREDIEIAGFLSSTIAWGNRKMIVRNGRRLMELMDDSPFDFVMHAAPRETESLRRFVHRTFNGDDLVAYVAALRRLWTEHGGVGAFFEREYAGAGDLRPVLSRFRSAFFGAEHPARTEKHLSSVDRGAACKRLNMYLRWMVRRDDRGVDFGLWTGIPASALYLPLDVHTASMGRALGLLARRQNDWRAVEEITGALRTFDPDDPVRFDFALFGAGMDGFLKN